MSVLSTYTALPVLATVGSLFCPSKTLLARSLAGSLGALLGTVVGGFFERLKREAAHSSVLRILADHMQTATGAEEIRVLIEAARRRFAVAPSQSRSEAFEDTAIQDIYLRLLSALVEGPEQNSSDLPTLRRLKSALDIDGILVGLAHKQAAQLLASKGYTNEDDDESRLAVDKLLFLSERAFADEEPEEARLYEMGRVRKVLNIADKEARERVTSFSQALYQQALAGVVDQVDALTAEVLVNASAAFGLDDQDAARMNVETYRQIASNLLADNSLDTDGRTTLARARDVLQLGERAATMAFVAVASPRLSQDVTRVARSLRSSVATGSPSVEELTQAAQELSRRRDELAMPGSAADAVAAEGFTAQFKDLYAKACKEVRVDGGEDKALQTLDELLAFVAAADEVLGALRDSASEASDASVATNSSAVAEVQGFPLTYPADATSAGRLYGFYLSRSLDRMAPEAAKPPAELARILELSEGDEQTARVETCQPKLQKFYLDSIERFSSGKVPMAMAKMAVDVEIAKYGMPFDAVEATALEVYRARVKMVAGKVIKVGEKEELDVERKFLDLSLADVRKIHLKAFGPVYEESVNEAMGRTGAMAPETHDGLEQLRDRLCLEKDDAARIFNGAVEVRLKDLMRGVKDAWEEATYSKEALQQVYKERGQDVGDDPSADGTGGELGIKESVPLDGVRGFKFMQEASKVADFYVGNKVFPDGATPGEDGAYPVTVGKYLEDKVKEEMYGIYAWNAVTCQDSFEREKWTRLKPHVGCILGLDSAKQNKVMCRMVSRWCNMFIKQRLQEQGELSDQDVSTLTDWVPSFFGINKDLTKEMVQTANKTLLQSKALRLINQPKVTAKEVEKLRKDVDMWDLTVQKDLELTMPQLRSLFRVQVSTALEDPNLSLEQKQDSVVEAREGYGLGAEVAAEELTYLLKKSCKGCLVNAVGNQLQGQTKQAMEEMQRLELLATFVEGNGMNVDQDWEVALNMRHQLVQAYASSAVGTKTAKQPNVKILERLLGLTATA